MKKAKSFTILELLLAMTISSLVMTGMMQSVRTTQKILARSRTLLNINKQVCLLFNQIERDFNTAIIVEESKPEPKKTDKDKKKTKPKSQKKEDTEEEKETDEKEEAPEKKTPKKGKKGEKKKETILFTGEADTDNSRKIEGKKYSPFIKVSFLNTNPMQIWGEKRERLVRVGYELVKNKEKSTKEGTSYDLIRKETAELKNTTFKEQDEAATEKQPPIRKHVVATNIKEMYIEYSMPKPKEEKKSKRPSDEEKKTIDSFTWGDKKETKNVVPQSVDVRISFWDEKLKGDKTYSCLIPVFSYPTIKKKPPTKAKKTPNNKKKKRLKKRDKRKRRPPRKAVTRKKKQ